ncbi:hypothetical protein DFH09DRAFT_1415125 [Mycena vulgaris]|nr:hypothetical protein DFH09DRAFT_1415125 [Mycena vulgaris]
MNPSNQQSSPSSSFYHPGPPPGWGQHQSLRPYYHQPYPNLPPPHLLVPQGKKQSGAPSPAGTKPANTPTQNTRISFLGSFRFTSEQEASDLWIGPTTSTTDTLQFDASYWEDKLGDLSNESLDTKLHLILSLVLFLGVSVRHLLVFIFTTQIKPVKDRAALPLIRTLTLDSQRPISSPSEAIVLEDSDRVITDILL